MSSIVKQGADPDPPVERLFAQPFVCALGKGHVDGVYSIATDPNSLARFASSSGDGIVKLWDLPTREETWATQAHSSMVKSLSWTREPGKLLSCGGSEVKLWAPGLQNDCISSWLGESHFNSLSHHRSKNSFAAATAGAIRIYDLGEGKTLRAASGC